MTLCFVYVLHSYVTAVFIRLGYLPVTGGLFLHASRPIRGVETLVMNIG